MKLLVVLALVATMLGATPDASATVSCPVDTLCLWPDVNQAGAQLNIDDRRRISNRVADVMNNETSSVENDTQWAAFLYSKRDGRGRRICVLPGETISDLSARNFNDTVSSTKVKRHVTCPA